MSLAGETAALRACSTWNLHTLGAWLPDVGCETLPDYWITAHAQYGIRLQHHSIL